MIWILLESMDLSGIFHGIEIYNDYEKIKIHSTSNMYTISMLWIFNFFQCLLYILSPFIQEKIVI